MSVPHKDYKLGSFIEKRLYEYQKNHTNRLINIITINKNALDASDTGTGKTYCAMAVCRFLKLKPIIICPKSIISAWIQVAKIFNVDPIFVVNYETIKLGRFYDARGQRIDCPYIQVTKDDQYTWKVPEDAIFIFDEVHKCSGMTTINSRILKSATKTGNSILMLSATIADRPERFMIFFYILQFIDPEYIKQSNVEFDKYMRMMERWLIRDNKPMVRIHHMLYPERASRIRIDDLDDEFPETQITSESYYMGKKRSDEIEKEYKLISQELDNIKSKEKKKDNPLVKILRAHQKIEMLKVATFSELAKDFIENGYSIVIFVNFTQTLESLCTILKTDCKIYGKQTLEQREKNIKDFMKNKEKIIVCNIKAGGVGVSLHDIHGGHPRVSLVSPTWSSLDLIQALGRVHRAGGKSKSLQRIVYAAKTVEEDISYKIREKLKNVSSINNGDLDLTNIEFKTYA